MINSKINIDDNKNDAPFFNSFHFKYENPFEEMMVTLTSFCFTASYRLVCTNTFLSTMYYQCE